MPMMWSQAAINAHLNNRNFMQLFPGFGSVQSQPTQMAFIEAYRVNRRDVDAALSPAHRVLRQQMVERAGRAERREQDRQRREREEQEEQEVEEPESDEDGISVTEALKLIIDNPQRRTPATFSDLEPDEVMELLDVLENAVLSSAGRQRFFLIQVICTDAEKKARSDAAYARAVARGANNAAFLKKVRTRATKNCGKWLTVSDDTVYDMVDNMRAWIDQGMNPEDTHSDAEHPELLTYCTFKVSNPKPRSPQLRQHHNNNGQYFPYLHTYACPALTATLARIGVWKEIDPKNYVDNCLCLAMESAGVHPVVLEDLRAACMLRAIPRRKIQEVAIRYGLRVEIRTFGSQNVLRVGPENGFQVKLAFFERHYFHDFRTIFNSWAIKNYDEVCDLPDWWNFRGPGKRENSRGISSFQLLQLIHEMKTHLTPIDMSTKGIFSTQFHDKAGREFQTLEYPPDAVRLTHPPRFMTDEEITEKERGSINFAKSKVARNTLERLQRKFARLGMGYTEQLKCLNKHAAPKARIFLDFESTTDGVRHRAYLGCWGVEGEERIYSTSLAEPGREFLDWVLDQYGSPVDDKETNKVTIIAHNITYDASFIMEYLQNLKMVERGTSIICGGGIYRTYDDPAGDWKVQLELKDSQRMIAGTLASFSQKFNLPIKKEVMPYELYTEEFIASGGMATEEELGDYADHQEIIANFSEFGLSSDDGKYDMIAYSRWYCQADVRLLREGWAVFRKDMLEHVDIDVNYYPTTASMADTYLKEQGCYDGVYEVSGVVREFISRCNIGGRVMCRWNLPCIAGGRIADFDAVGLYTSAMITILGYLLGRPLVWDLSVNLAQADGYFLRIRVNSVPKRYAFPITRLPTKGDGNDWTNDLEGKEIYVDRFTLEDLCFFCSTPEEQFDFTILQGYYFKSGRNTKINDEMMKLFNIRLELKKLKSSAQEGIKLICNSAYGICGMKPIDTDISYLAGDQSLAFLHNHHNHIKAFTHMPNNTVRYETYKAIGTHFNRQHISSEVLSWSKRIMNRVMCLADDLGIMIYYTDTDSMHIDADGVDYLAAEFKKIHGKELIGNGVCQFHTDFDFKTCLELKDGRLAKNTTPAVGEIYATKSIFLGKKSYIDQLTDDAGNEAYHVRLKGIPNKCITNKANAEYDGDPMSMFEDLYYGDRVDFYLGEGGHVMFKTGKNHQISSEKMIRSIQFKSDNDYDMDE